VEVLKRAVRRWMWTTRKGRARLRRRDKARRRKRRRMRSNGELILGAQLYCDGCSM
jgi:hypothetical protein